jgi:hypothetical protein
MTKNNKERSVTFSITVFETVESGEDTVDLGDGEIEVVFTGKILPGMAISEMAKHLRKVIKSKKIITGKLVDVMVCS